MRIKYLFIFCALVLLFTSCQKELNFDSPTTTSGGGSSNGDLFVKALQISVSTNDTNTITMQWDAAKRLLQYKSSGRVNGVATNILYVINRDNAGKIQTIVSKSSLMGGLIDSIVYQVHYLNGSTRLSYVNGTKFSTIGNINDSSVFTYNAAGQVSSKETFSDFFGTMDPESKQDYQYDANGNVLKITDFNTDFNGGYTQSAVTTNTFGTHKAAVILGEESYIVLGAANVSKNNLAQDVTNAVASGTTYTTVVSQQQFNSFDRPSQEIMTVNSQPTPLAHKIFYFYQ
jgi:hypothetical protein